MALSAPGVPTANPRGLKRPILAQDWHRDSARLRLMPTTRLAIPKYASSSLGWLPTHQVPSVSFHDCVFENSGRACVADVAISNAATLVRSNCFRAISKPPKLCLRSFIARNANAWNAFPYGRFVWLPSASTPNVCCVAITKARRELKRPDPPRRRATVISPPFLAERSRGLARCRLSVGNYGGRL